MKCLSPKAFNPVTTYRSSSHLELQRQGYLLCIMSGMMITWGQLLILKVYLLKGSEGMGNELSMDV